MSERVPPCDEAAERAAIGCALLDGYAVVSRAQTEFRLKPESWFVPACRVTAEALFAMASEGRSIDTLTVAARLGVGGKLEGVGGEAFLAGCVEAAVTPAHAGGYLDLVRQGWVRRCAIGVAREVEAEAFGTENGDALLAGMADRILGVVEPLERTVKTAELVSGLELRWRDAREKRKPAIGVTLPWQSLTELMCGLEPGVTIVAGRPSAGKTTFEDQVALWAAGQDAPVPVARVSCDSTREELLARAMCRRAGVSLPKLKFGHAGERDLGAVHAAREWLEKLPFWIEDRIFDVRAIRSWFRMMRARYGIGLATVDYIQQVNAEEMGREQWNTVARVTHVSREMKHLAMEMKMPVVLLSQLSREVEKENRAPQLSDLRDSGAIEQDAEKVVFVYRDAKKCKEMDERSPGATKHKRAVWVDVVKHKNGQTGKIPFWLYPPYFRFEPAESSADGRVHFVDDALPSAERREGGGESQGFLPEVAR